MSFDSSTMSDNSTTTSSSTQTPSSTMTDDFTQAQSVPPTQPSPDMISQLLIENQSLKTQLSASRTLAATEIAKYDEHSNEIIAELTATYQYQIDFALRRLITAQDENLALQAQSRDSAEKADEAAARVRRLESENRIGRNNEHAKDFEIDALKLEKRTLSERCKRLSARQRNHSQYAERLEAHIEHLEAHETTEVANLRYEVQELVQERAATALLHRDMNILLGQIEAQVARRQASTTYVTGMLGRAQYDLSQSRALVRFRESQISKLETRLEIMQTQVDIANELTESIDGCMHDMAEQHNLNIETLLAEVRINHQAAQTHSDRRAREIADYKDHVALLEQIEADTAGDVKDEAEERPCTAEQHHTGLHGFIGLGQPGYMRPVSDAWARSQSQSRASRQVRAQSPPLRRVDGIADLRGKSRAVEAETDRIRGVMAKADEIVATDGGLATGLRGWGDDLIDELCSKW